MDDAGRYVIENDTTGSYWWEGEILNDHWILFSFLVLSFELSSTHRISDLFITSLFLKYFPSPPVDSIEEIIALTDPSLNLFTGEEESACQNWIKGPS